MNRLPSLATVLIVDDSPQNISMLHAALQDEYSLKAATSGKQAIEICLSMPVDLILLDVMMPEMDGFETCRHLKEHHQTREIPVIFVTARDEVQDESTGFSCGAIDYINKPIHPTIVRARVKTHLALYHQNRILEKRVKERTAKIRQINESLEQQVAARTEELYQAKAVAEAANNAKSRFLTNMSHELRTPLNSIIGFTDVVLTRNVGPLNEVQDEYLGYVLQSSKHLLDLINDILDLSKIEVDKMELKLGAVRIRELLSNSLIIVREIAHHQNVHLQEEFAADLPATITVDERKLKQILYNLLSNAIKFSPSGGIVTLSAGFTVELPAAIREKPAGRGIDTGPLLCITVSDTGNGVEPDDLERIFNPFEQADNSDTRAFEGTGLGLSLTRKLLELHGGVIWAESGGRGKGSAFHAVLPIQSGRVKHENTGC